MADTTTASATTEIPSPADMLRRFVEQKASLLDTLHDTYSDDPVSAAYEPDVGPAIAAERTHFLTAVKGNPDAEEDAIRTWHQTMKPFYSMCQPGHEAAVVGARPFQLVKLKFPEMWADVRLSDESRAMLFQYVSNLNQASVMFCTMGSGALEPLISAMSESGIADALKSGDMSSMDPTALMSALASAASSVPADSVEPLKQNVMSMVDSLGGVDGLLNQLGSVGLPPAMVEFAKTHAQQFSAEMMAGGAAAAGAGGESGSAGIDLSALAAHIAKHGTGGPPSE